MSALPPESSRAADKHSPRLNLSSLAIQRPVATILISLAIVALGILGFSQLPVASLPQVEFPTLSISASLPGADPETMATTVATPIENALSGISGIKEMTSTSSKGSTNVNIQFQLDKKISEAIQDVQAALNSAQKALPQSMPAPPTWRKQNPADTPILILSAYSSEMSLIELSDLIQNNVARQLTQIDGVAQVNIFGQRKPALNIKANPLVLASHGLDFSDIRNAVAKASLYQPKGNMIGEHQTSSIEANDQLVRPEEFAEIPLVDANGTQLRLGDIATASYGTDNPYVYSEQNGKEGLAIAISRQPDANVVETVDRIKKALPALESTLPASVTLSELNDRTRTIRTTLHEVELTLIITMVLVIVVMGLFLRQKAPTAIVAIVLLVSLISTFAGMWLFNFSLNNLSLMALIIAVGFVVDDAIVVVENIYRHIELGATPLEAAHLAMGEIGFTVLSISLSLVAAFIPLLFMGGIVGRLFKEFAITVTLAILMSAVTSLLLAPSLAGHFIPKTPAHKAGENRAEAATPKNDFSSRLTASYARLLKSALKHPRTMLVIFFATILLTGFMFRLVPKGFLPEQDTGFLQGSTTTAEVISFKDSVKLHQQVGKIIGQSPDVETYALAVGGGASGGAQSFSNGRLLITLKPLGKRKISIQQWIEQMRPKLAKVQGIQVSLRPAQEINFGMGNTRSSYQYLLRSSDGKDLTEWAQKLTSALRQIPYLTDVNNEQKLGALVTPLKVDRTVASRYGITMTDIDNALYDAYGQRRIAQYQTAASQYNVNVGIDDSLAGKVSSLGNIFIQSPVTGGMIPLSAVATLQPPARGPVEIQHQNLYPAVTISFNLKPNVALGDAMTAIDQATEKASLPDTIQASYGGSAQVFGDSLASQPLLIIAALLAVYIVLGVLYESLLDPVVILSTLPSAGLGAVLALWLTHSNFDLIALIGLILLIGIVKKNGIMIVDFAKQAHERGASYEEAIYEACVIRFRPIMMTSIAAALGAIPLIWGFGEGAELRKPLGIAILGGLVVSQILTLFTTPIIYLYVEKWAIPKKRQLAENNA